MRRCGAAILFALLYAVLSLGLNAQSAAASVTPASVGTWTAVTPLSVPRNAAASVLLSDGRVLVVGGLDAGGLTLNSTDFVNSDGTVTPGPALNVGRSGHTATLLAGNLVLVTGGDTATGATNTAEVFDPTANAWTLLTSTLNDARSGHAAFVLPDSTVAIIGGSNGSSAVAAVELYDPSSKQFTYLGVLNTPRSNPAIAVLTDGRLLVAGGSDASGATLATTEIFAPATGFSTSGPSLTTPRSGASASTLVDGRVAIVGGSYPEGAQNGVAELASVELIDAILGLDTVAPVALTTARTGQVASLLPANNAVLVADGTNAGNPISSAELFLPWNNTVIDSAPASSHQGGSVAAGSGILTLAGGSSFAAVEQYGYATLQSDLPGYHPGQLVTLTGSGWQPAETVTLTQVQTPPIDGSLTSQVTADANGNIVSANYAPSPLDVGTSYTVTAVGSKSQAQIQFTDAGTPYQLAFTNAARVVVPGECSSAIIIQSQDSLGVSSAVSSAVTVNLATTSGTGTFYAVSGCTGGAVTSATVAAKASSVDVYYTDTVAGSPVISSLSNTAGLLSPVPQTETVNLGNTTTKITASPTGSSPYGTLVQFTVTVAPKSPATGIPTGSVNIMLAGVLYASNVSLDSTGTAVTTPALPGSGGGFTAVYAGDANYNGSNSSGVSVTVAKVAVAATPIVTASANPSTYGSVTFTATALPNAPGLAAPGGAVTFKSGATILCGGAMTNTGGMATCTTTTLATGSHDITATFATDSNYLAATSSTLVQVVSQAVLTVTANNLSMTYGGTVPSLLGAYTVSGLQNNDQISTLWGTKVPALSTTATSSSPAAQYTISISLGTLPATLTNYTYAFVNGTMTVNPTSVTASVTAANKQYDGTSNATISGCSLTGVLAGDIGKVTCSAASAAFASSSASSTPQTVTAAGITLSGTAMGNYQLASTSATTTATINPFQVTASVTAASKPYDGTSNATITGCSPTGVLAGDSGAVTCAAASAAFASSNANSTPQTVTATGITLNGGAAGNYQLVSTSATTTATINPASVTASVTAISKPYDGTSTANITGCSLTGLLSADNGKVTCSAASATFASSNASSTPQTVTAAGITLSGGAGNYQLVSTSATTTATINAASVTASVTAISKPYDGTSTATTSCSLTGVIAADSSKVTCSAASAAFASSSASSTPQTVTAVGITLSGGSSANYQLVSTSATTTATINSAPVTASVTAANKPYDGTSSATITGCSLTVVIAGDKVTCSAASAAFASPAAISQTVTATGITLSGGAGNYQLVSTSATTTATINPASLTITAGNQSKNYGQTATLGTTAFAVNGLINGDTVGSVTLTSTGAAATAAAGAYAIMPSAPVGGTFATSNYNISYVNGSLTVNPISLTVTVANARRIYGAANPVFGGTLTGLANGDNITASYGTAASATSPTGTYPITATLVDPGNAIGNYTVTNSPGTLTITAAALNIAVQAATKTYGAANPAFTPIYTGFVSGDTASVLGGTLLFSTPATASSTPGNYSVTPGGVISGNYAITFTPGTLTVTPASLTVTANNLSRNINTANPAFTYTVAGYVNGDGTSVVTGSASCSSTATTSSPAGSYPITCTTGTLSAQNYTFGLTPGTLSVLPGLVESNVSVSPASPITSGTVITVSDTATNNSVSSTFGTVLYYFSTTTSASGSVYANRSTGLLGVMASSSGTTKITVPSLSGSYYLVACLATCSSTPITIVPPPPAVLAESNVSVSPASPITSGTVITVSDTVTDSGSAGFGTVLFYFSTTTSPSGGVYGNRSTGLLAVGASSSGTTKITVPGLSGSYYLVACLTTCSSTPITIVPPPPAVLAESNVSVSPASPITHGTVITVSDTVTDSGSAGAGTVLFYFSPTTSPSGGVSGNRSTGLLAVGASSSGTTKITVPGLSGSYYLVACVTTCSSTPITIN